MNPFIMLIVTVNIKPLFTLTEKAHYSFFPVPSKSCFETMTHRNTKIEESTKDESAYTWRLLRTSYSILPSIQQLNLNFYK